MKALKFNLHLLYNPFLYIAGLKSVFLSIILILFTSGVSYFSGTHNLGLINIKFAKDTVFSVFLLEHTIYWLTVSLLLFIAGIIFSKSRIRWIDVFGTQGIARFPLVFLPILRLFPMFESFLINSINMYFLFSVHVAMVIWTIALMFNAYKVTCNVKSHQLIFSFIICLFIAELISRIFIHLLTNYTF